MLLSETRPSGAKVRIGLYNRSLRPNVEFEPIDLQQDIVLLKTLQRWLPLSCCKVLAVCTLVVPHSHQIRISPEKSEFDANLIRMGRYCGAALMGVRCARSCGSVFQTGLPCGQESGGLKTPGY